MADDNRELAKVGNILAMLLTKDMGKAAAATTLESCGFSNKEISVLTQSSEGSVRAMLSQSRRKRPESNG